MSTLKVDTIKSDTTPTVTISDGLSITGVTTSAGHVDIPDGKQIRFGDSNDLQIWHDGSNSIIKDNGTGSLLLYGDAINLGSAAGEYYIRAFENGAVSLRYDNSTKLETSSYGVHLGDSVRLTLGGSTGTPDCHFYHDTTDTNIQNITGDLIIKSNSDGDKAIVVKNGAATELYNDNAKKFETYSGGCKVYSDLSVRGVEGGSAVLSLVSDEGDDNADNWRFVASADHSLYLQNWAGGAWENNIVNTGNGAVELYYDNVKTFETAEGGGIFKGAEGGSCVVYMQADEGDDNADKWVLKAVEGSSTFQIRNLNSGSWQENFVCNGSDSTDLYFNGTKTFSTQDFGAQIDGVTNPTLRILGGAADGAAILHLTADEGASHEDNFRILASSEQALKFQSKTGGNWTNRFQMNSNGDLYGTDTSISSISDSRLKKNTADFTYDLAKFKQFKPKTFEWINTPEHASGTQRGFIAQDLESIDSNLVLDIILDKESTDLSLVESDKIAKTAKLGSNDSMYISVIQQLITKIETLETKVAALESA